MTNPVEPMIRPETMLDASVIRALDAVQQAGADRYAKWEEWQRAEAYYEKTVRDLRAAIHSAEAVIDSRANTIRDLLRFDVESVADYMRKNPTVHKEALRIAASGVEHK